jgi:hypothetical protein
MAVSELAEAMIVNAAVLGSVLGTDLGPARKIGRMRIVRPLVVAGVIIPLFVKGPATGGTGLALEVGASILGLICGLAAVALMRVYRSPQTGQPVSRAGFGYAALWAAVVGARAAFSYGCVHWFPVQLVHFGIAHQVTVAALTDSLIFMAVTMLVTRTLGLWTRAARLAPAAGAAEIAPVAVGSQA